MQAHLQFLAQHASMIKAAGPLRDNEGSGAGGLWLVEVDTPDAVNRLVRTDPLWPTGLRRSVRVLHWKQVFAEGAPLEVRPLSSGIVSDAGCCAERPFLPRSVNYTDRLVRSALMLRFVRARTRTRL
jgi:uncharacterized protein